MRVLVTGVHGYIGSVLAPYLMGRGLEVVGLDTGYYRDGWLYSDNSHLPRSPLTLNMDLRHAEASDLAGFDAVAHLAELSNDPLGQNRPAVTNQINHKGSVQLALLARTAGVRLHWVHQVGPSLRALRLAEMLLGDRCGVKTIASGEFHGRLDASG